MTVKRLDRIAWGRSGRPVSRADRAVLLTLIRKHERASKPAKTKTEAAVESVAAQVATRRGGLGQTGVTTPRKRARPPPE